MKSGGSATGVMVMTVLLIISSTQCSGFLLATNSSNTTAPTIGPTNPDTTEVMTSTLIPVSSSRPATTNPSSSSSPPSVEPTRKVIPSTENIEFDLHFQLGLYSDTIFLKQLKFYLNVAEANVYLTEVSVDEVRMQFAGRNAIIHAHQFYDMTDEELQSKFQILSMTATPITTSAPQPPPKKPSLLYLGIGAGVVVLAAILCIVYATRKNERENDAAQELLSLNYSREL